MVRRIPRPWLVQGGVRRTGLRFFIASDDIEGCSSCRKHTSFGKSQVVGNQAAIAYKAGLFVASLPSLTAILTFEMAVWVTSSQVSR